MLHINVKHLPQAGFFGIFDVTGQAVHPIDDINASNIDISLKGVSKGMYMLKVWNADFELMATSRILRQ